MRKIIALLVAAFFILILGGCETVPVVVDTSGVIETQSNLAAAGAAIDAGTGVIVDHSQELADALAKLAANDVKLKAEYDKAARVAKEAVALKAQAEKLNKDIEAARDEVTASILREAETSEKLIVAKQEKADLEKQIWPLRIILVSLGAFILLYIFVKVKGLLRGFP
jgi:chromosome segregation ATPase